MLFRGIDQGSTDPWKNVEGFEKILGCFGSGTQTAFFLKESK